MPSIAARVLHRLSAIIYKAPGRRHSLVGSPQAWKKSRAFQREFLISRGLAPSHRLIDIGCGTLRGGLPLIELLDVGHYTGLEVRPEMLEEARRELREAGLEGKNPNLILSDDFSAVETDRADYIWGYAVLIHMTDAILDECMGFVSSHLEPGGEFLAAVNLGEEGQPGSWRGFPVMRHPLEFWESLSERHGMRCEDLGSMVDVGDRGDEGALPPQERRMFRFWRPDGR